MSCSHWAKISYDGENFVSLMYLCFDYLHHQRLGTCNNYRNSPPPPSHFPTYSNHFSMQSLSGSLSSFTMWMSSQKLSPDQCSVKNKSSSNYFWKSLLLTHFTSRFIFSLKKHVEFPKCSTAIDRRNMSFLLYWMDIDNCVQFNFLRTRYFHLSMPGHFFFLLL